MSLSRILSRVPNGMGSSIRHGSFLCVRNVQKQQGYINSNVSGSVHHIPARTAMSVYAHKLKDVVTFDDIAAQSEKEGFGRCGVLPEFTQILQSQGISEPTEIQRLAIPALLTGVDGAVGAQTGTGKTLAFLLPILQRIVLGERKGEFSRSCRPRAIIMTHSRELALQIEQAAKDFTRHPKTKFRISALFGGYNRKDMEVVMKGEESANAIKALSSLRKYEIGKLKLIMACVRRILHTYNSAQESPVFTKAEIRQLTRHVCMRVYLQDNQKLDHETEVTDLSEFKVLRTHVFEYAEKVVIGTKFSTFEVNTNTIERCLQKLGEEIEIDFVTSMPQNTLEMVLYDAVQRDMKNLANIEQSNEDFEQDQDDEVVALHNNVEGDLLTLTKEWEDLRFQAMSGAFQDYNRHRNIDILIATPGRLVKLMQDDLLFVSDVRMLAVDEADFLFHSKSGFDEDLETFLLPLKKRTSNDFFLRYNRWPEDYNRESLPQALPNPGNPLQLIFAGASLGGNFLKYVKEFFPVFQDKYHPRALVPLEAKNNMCLPKKLRRTWIRAGNRDRLDILKELLSNDMFKLEKDCPSSVMVFCNSVTSCQAVSMTLQEAGISVCSSHSQIPVVERKQHWSRFYKREASVMVSTDLGARGLDTRFVTQVINFDFPLNPVDFLHRAGRVARASDEGHVINLLVKGDEVLAKAIDAAHEQGRPITSLSSDKEYYRTDIAPELRKGAELFSNIPKHQIVAKRVEAKRQEQTEQRERADQRKEEYKEEILKRKISQMPWQRRGQASGGTRHSKIYNVGVHDDYSKLQKKENIKRVIKDIKQQRSGDEKVNKNSDREKAEAEELKKKTRFAKAKGVDFPITSKSKSVETLMSDKAISDKIDSTLKEMRYKSYKKEAAANK